MRIIKGFLLLACRGLVLFVGFYLSFVLAGLLGLAGFQCGLVLTAVGLLMLRPNTSRVVCKCDVAGWTRSQAERKLHPTRRRFKRLAIHVLVWLPSAVAALVLFFFPIASHLAHPSSRYLSNYRVPVPWTFTVLPFSQPTVYNWINVLVSSSGSGRFGITPFAVPPLWMMDQPISVMTFGAEPNSAAFGAAMLEQRRKEASQVQRRELRLGDGALTCWQYRAEDSHFGESRIAWAVDCETPVAVYSQYFYARFYGREQDLRSFYQLIESITPVE
jgi:hypothetical protein